MTVMDHIRRNGKYYLIAIAVFFGISIFGGFGVGNFGSSMSGPRNQQQQEQQQVRELSEQLPTLAKFNEREIDTASFMRSFNRMEDARMRRGQAVTTPQERGKLMQQVLDGMFQAEYLISYGEENGVEVSDADVNQRVNQQIKARLQQDSQQGDPHILKDIQESIRMWQGREQALQQILAQSGMSEQEYRKQLKRSLQVQRGRQKFMENKREELKQSKLTTAEQVKKQLDEGELSWEEAVKQHHADENAAEDGGLIESPIGRNSFPTGQEGTDSLYQDFLKPRPEEGSIVGPLFLGDGIYIFQVMNWVELDPEQVDEKREELASDIVEQLDLSGTSEVTDEQVIAFERKAKVKAIKFATNFQQSIRQTLQKQVEEATKVVYHPFINAWRAEQGLADWSEEAVKNGREFTEEQKTEVSISSGQGGTFQITRTTKPRYNESVEFMNAALELRPNYSLYNYYQAELYNRWQQAWAKYDQATEQASAEGSEAQAQPASTSGGGQSEEGSGESASGEDSGQQSGQQEPDKPWNGRPELSADEIAQERLTLLEKASQASIGNNEYNADIHFALAKVYRERGETEKAKEQLQYTIDYSGRDRELITNAKTIAEEMQFTSLVEDAQTALDNIPDQQRGRRAGGGGGPQIQLGGSGGGQSGGGQTGGGPPQGFGEQPPGQQGGQSDSGDQGETGSTGDAEQPEGSGNQTGDTGNEDDQSAGTGGPDQNGAGETGQQDTSENGEND